MYGELEDAAMGAGGKAAISTDASLFRGSLGGPFFTAFKLHYSLDAGFLMRQSRVRVPGGGGGRYPSESESSDKHT